MSDEAEETLWVHFEELSTRFRRVVIAIVASSMIVMSIPADISNLFRLDFNEYNLLVSRIIEALQVNLLPEGVTLIAFNWLDSFYIYMAVSFATGFLICLPYTAYQTYSFLAPAIYENEKKRLITFVTVFISLFALGVLYAYYVLLPVTFTVLYRFVYQTRVIPFYSFKDFFNMILFGLFGSGLFYTFPLIIYFLVTIDLLELDSLRGIRRQLFVALAIVTAIITPDPTPVSMLLMTVPFYLIYEATILVLGLVMKKSRDDVIENGLRVSLSMLAKQEADGDNP
jgi:sec-independent protein translocase protein TatC